jgi:hypothetical protein
VASASEAKKWSSFATYKESANLIIGTKCDYLFLSYCMYFIFNGKFIQVAVNKTQKN